jgi:hypothetical protein
MKLACCLEGFSPKPDMCFGVNNQSSSQLADGRDHSLSDSILVVTARRVRLLGFTDGGVHRAEALGIILSLDIIAPKLSNLLA